VTPEWIYNVMSRLGLAGHRVSRFRGKQSSALDRLGESVFLSRRHIDWSRTRAYAQGNFGQIFLNIKGRQPSGCVAPEDARPLLSDLKAGLMEILHPGTGQPLLERVCEREELYHGPYAHLAPDLTVVLNDWRYRTIGLHDFTTHKVISPAFGPTGDHRMEGILIAAGPAFRAGASPRQADLLDIAPTVLHLLGIPVPDDMDGRVLTELLEPSIASAALEAIPDVTAGAYYQPELAGVRAHSDGEPSAPLTAGYTENENEEIQQRLADLGYL
jgi:hypothetical protein